MFVPLLWKSSIWDIWWVPTENESSELQGLSTSNHVINHNVNVFYTTKQYRSSPFYHEHHNNMGIVYRDVRETNCYWILRLQLEVPILSEHLISLQIFYFVGVFIVRCFVILIYYYWFHFQLFCSLTIVL